MHVIRGKGHPCSNLIEGAPMRTSILVAASLVAVALAQPANAVEIVYRATLDGASESPPVASPATGSVQVTFDTDAMTMMVSADFAGLIGATTASHIHCCTLVAGEGTVGVATYPATFPGFPLGVQSGSYLQTIDMTAATSYTAAFLTASGGTPDGAFAALLAGLDDGRGYFNIHTNFAPGGEIRGFLTEVVEPGTLMLLGFGLVAIGFVHWRRGN
jgi:CHRD domain/PEP-CTERM motif